MAETRPHDRATTRRRPARCLVVIAALVASLLVPSPASAEDEFHGFPNPEEFVTQQYLDFLSRAPDDAGLRFWADRLRRGTSPAALVENLVESAEFGETVAPLIRLYRAYFLRAPDVDGLSFWADVVRDGSSLRGVSDAFARSPEFERRYGALDDREFVGLVYRNVLGRRADNAGLAFWVARLQAGWSRGAVMVGFSESPEYVAATDGEVRATMLYIGLLKRRPDPSGLAYWAGVLDDGTPYTTPMAGFLTSDEYRERLATIFTARLPLTGEAARVVPNRPALVLKIDNHDRARPQVGLNAADIVFEELVEGSITRFAAVFHEQVPSRVGPVRSARTGDIDLVLPLDRPLFGASGANRVVLSTLEGADVVRVDALVSQGYVRDERRRAPHNLMAVPATLLADDRGRAGRPPALLRYRAPGAAAGGTPAGGVDIDFGFTDVTYRWNGGGWARTQNGSNHLAADGRQVAPPNVIVQFTEYGVSAADAESPEAISVGSGRALVYTGGNVIEATWQRARGTDPIRYLDGRGRDVLLAPGRTWIALAPAGTVTPR